jgi:hypothetical protein
VNVLTTTTSTSLTALSSPQKAFAPETHPQKQISSLTRSTDTDSNSNSNTDSNSNSNNNATPTATVAYAISLIKCGDFQSSTAGMNDAALVLRHSIHQNSIRNNNRDTGKSKKSNYDYKMYAIVHTNAVDCSHGLKKAGFTIVVRDAPVLTRDIQGDYLRKKIHKEWCCGADEFIKLYAYTLPEPIVVHVDVDYVMHQPMDDLFDAMLPIQESDTFDMQARQRQRQKEARQRVPLEILKHGNGTTTNTVWPEHVTAFMTRDWPQVMPGRMAGYQAGFLVIQPDRTAFDEIVAIIKKGDYVEGFQRANGWGGLGYGGFVGAMAMQGLLAYYYDVHRPDSWMELNQCRFNHMGMDVLYRSQPAFRPGHKKRGKCRNDLDYCEDCMHTPLDQIYNIHYTQCRKPWNCIGLGSLSEGGDKKSIPEDSVHLDHCMELLTVWHSHRTDLETKLLALTGDETIEEGRKSDYKKQFFQGHCSGEGQENYHVLSGRPETFKRLVELYA